MSASKTSGTETCRHCRQPVPPAHRETGFCCTGCRYVFELIHSEELDRFYDLAPRRDLQPVGDTVFRPAGEDWAVQHQQEAEARSNEDTGAEAGDLIESTLETTNLSCAACIWLIENRFEKCPGSARITIDPTDGTTRLWWHPGKFDLAAFVADCARFGYGIRLPSIDADGTPAAEKKRGHALGVRLGAASSFALNAMAFTLPRYFGMDSDFLFASLFELVAAASATLAAIAALTWFGPRAWQALRSGVPHIDLPIVLGIGAAWIGSIAGWILKYDALLYFDFVAVFSTLMLAGRWVQERAMAATRNQLRGPGLPRQLIIETGAETFSLPAADLEQGMHYRINPGEVIPVDSLLPATSGAATISREWIDGESHPQTVETGNVITAGSRNIGNHYLSLHALENFAGSELAGLARTADPSRNDDNRFGGRLLQIYLWAVIVLALGGGLYQWIANGNPLGGLQVTISILVVSCPCALGVAIPLADRLAARNARNSGAIVRTPKLWQRLQRVRHLVFDKTGTLTVEFPQLLNPEALEQLTDIQKQHLLHLVTRNRHPFGLALRATLMQLPVTAPDPGQPLVPELKEIPGKGMQLVNDESSQPWSLGSSKWLDSASVSEADDDSEDAESQADCVFAHGDDILARFHFREQIRDNARDEIHWLQQHIGPASILSGDRHERVQQLASRIGLSPENALGDHSPEAKASWLDEHNADRTLFVGDGANDRHAFDRSLARGAPLSAFAPLEDRIDFVLLGGSLSPLRHLFQIAKRHRRALHTILVLGIGYNLVAITLCLYLLMHPLLAAIAMPLSSLAILTVASLLLRPANPLTDFESADTVSDPPQPDSRRSPMAETAIPAPSIH